jgi:hypothetical protein
MCILIDSLSGIPKTEFSMLMYVAIKHTIHFSAQYYVAGIMVMSLL